MANPSSIGPEKSAPASQTEATVVHAKRRSKRRHGKSVAAVLIAHAPASVTRLDKDRIAIGQSCVVGRGSEASLRVPDVRLSQKHFRISKSGSSYQIEDLGSTNGTLVDGQPLDPGQGRELSSPSLLRAGGCVFVFHPDASAVLEPFEMNVQQPMAGKFHVPVLLRQLMEAALSRRAPLLAGLSGVGKEHAADVLASLWGLGKPRRYNVASATSPEEMSRALFGVASKAFTGVGEQPGLIVTAAKQSCPLFLDEVHHLSPEAQATLLTVIEDGKFSRKGAESEEVRVDVRFVLASNEPDKLKHDLRARLWRVDIPSLRDRVADVPDIFGKLLERQLAHHSLEASAGSAEAPWLDTDVCYDLCLEALRGKAFEQSNVRGLADLADRIAVRVASGTSVDDSIDSVLDERVSLRAREPETDVSHYERYRELISAVYLGCGKNAKKTVDLLRDAGLSWTISRRHLTLNVERWGLK